MFKPTQPPRERVISWASLGFVAAVSAFLGGAVALAMVALMLWFCRSSWVIDDAESHGISELQSSRLGGIAVFLGTFAFFAVAEWAAVNEGISIGGGIFIGSKLPNYSSYVLLIALVGLWDDFVTRFQPLLRLVLVLAVSLAAFASNAVSLNANTFDWLPFGLNNSIALVVASTMVVTGFVNAGNMADGANGLLGIIGISFFCVAMFYDKASFAPLIIMALLIFLLFNMVTGRIFLGDFGAYGLSALIAFGSLEMYSSGNVSLWFLGSLLGYPCVEMCRVVISRMFAGTSPFLASNDHLHNYLYELLRKWGWNRIVANSTTGACLAFVSAFLPASIVVLGVVDIDSTDFWGLYFLIYAALHLILAIFLAQRLHIE